MFNKVKILLSFFILGLLIGCTDWNIDPEEIETPDPVTVTITAVTDSSVTINWTESLDNKFLSYTVYYDEVSPVDTTAENTADTIFLKQDTHKTITGLKSETPYFFRVGVNSTLGSSSFSTEVDTSTFEKIADKKLVLNEVNSIDMFETSIHLKWSKDWEDGFGKGDYVIYYSLSNSVDTNSFLFDTVDTNAATVDSLLRDTTYYFKVYQLRNGVPSAGSNIVSAKTTKGEPIAVKVNKKVPTNNSITLSWSTSVDTSDFKRYFVVLNTVTAVDTFSWCDTNAANVYLMPIDSIDSTSIIIDSIGDDTLVMNTVYWFSVYVEDMAGNVTPTAPDSIRTDDGIADPVSVTIDSVTDTSVFLNWTQNKDADFVQYLIYYGTTDSVSEDDTLEATIGETKTISHKISGLKSLTKYWFRVFVKSSYGILTPSNEVVNFPVILYSDLDTIINGADTSYAVNLIWQGGDDYNSDSFKKYVVYRSESSFSSILNGDKKDEITDIGTYDYQDTTVIKNKTYYYRIYHQSLNNDGYLVEQFSNEVVVEVK